MKRWFGCGALIVVAVGVVLGSLAAVAVVRGEIVRREVALDAAWARLEGAYRRRVDLVPPLIQTIRATGVGETPGMTRLEEARERAALPIGTPSMLEDREAFREFREAHRDLGRALDAVRGEAVDPAGAPRTRTLDGLLGELDRVEARIGEAEEAFVDAVEAYNAAIERLPHSLVARLFGFRAKPVPLSVGRIDDTPYNAAPAEEP